MVLRSYDKHRRTATIVLLSSITALVTTGGVIGSDSPENVERVAGLLNTISFGAILLSTFELLRNRSRGNQVVNLATRDGLTVTKTGLFKRKIAD